MMGKRPKKKVVLFLVEGRSDREALQIGISELYDEIDNDTEVFFPTIRVEEEERGGDITTCRYKDKRSRTWWVSPTNIEEAIYLLFLEDFFDEMKIMPKDITEIIQIVDMDGAYITDDRVLLDQRLSEEESPYYADTSINCLDVAKIVRRNKQKRENLDHLCAKTTIQVKQKTVPYSVYFFSANLDHFIHHDANLDYRNKISLAQSFSSGFIGDTDGFVRTFSEDADAITGMTYDESWKYIKKGINSLARHTNLNILLEELYHKGSR